jgi:hypothetical protein
MLVAELVWGTPCQEYACCCTCVRLTAELACVILTAPGVPLRGSAPALAADRSACNPGTEALDLVSSESRLTRLLVLP